MALKELALKELAGWVTSMGRIRTTEFRDGPIEGSEIVDERYVVKEKELLGGAEQIVKAIKIQRTLAALRIEDRLARLRVKAADEANGSPIRMVILEGHWMKDMFVSGDRGDLEMCLYCTVAFEAQPITVETN